jgi:hypothetical protein
LHFCPGVAKEIVQHDLAIRAQSQIFLVQFFQVGGKTHQTAFFPAMPKSEGMAQLVQAQLGEPVQKERMRRPHAVRVSPGAKYRDNGSPPPQLGFSKNESEYGNVEIDRGDP